MMLSNVNCIKIWNITIEFLCVLYYNKYDKYACYHKKYVFFSLEGTKNVEIKYKERTFHKSFDPIDRDIYHTKRRNRFLNIIYQQENIHQYCNRNNCNRSISVTVSCFQT